MTDIGTYKGSKGLERLFLEIRKILSQKEQAIVAVAGLPGTGKTYMAKSFVRLGFGNIPRKDIMVIDDNIIYSTRFWKLNWEKLQLEKKSSKYFLNSVNARVVFFSNWIPSRFLELADIYVIFKLSEQERVNRLQKREKRAPEKFLVHKTKNTISMEKPFKCPIMITLLDPSSGMYKWHFIWLIRRLLACSNRNA